MKCSPSTNVYGKGKATYSAEQIDALVVHIPPCNVWYVLPVEALGTTKNLRFYPDMECKTARWEHFREAWQLIAGAGPVRGKAGRGTQ